MKYLMGYKKIILVKENSVRDYVHILMRIFLLIVIFYKNKNYQENTLNILIVPFDKSKFIWYKN